MKGYLHKVQYYETDRMGVVHHSNYIRWMEEARIDLMTRVGLPYTMLEKEGLISPVVRVDCSYKYPCRFGDVVTVKPILQQYKGARFTFAYKMYLADGTLVSEAESTHCFTDQNGRPISLQRKRPDLYEKLAALIGTDVYEEESLWIKTKVN